MPHVTYQLDGNIATITMDDGKVNALSLQMFEALDAALDRAAADRAVVVLAGREGILSAGFDLGVLMGGGPDAAAMVRAGFELAHRVLCFPTPVVVACTGHAIAMGAFLLLSGDYRVGADGPYRITANEVAIGITVPRAAIEICRQRLQPSHFNRAVTLAEPFGPADAVVAGFLDRTVPPAETVEVARAVAAQMAMLNLDAHAATKLLAREPALSAVRAAIEADAAALRALV